MNKLNIGCGRDYRDGWINIDLSREVNADLYLDIRKDPLPYLDQSVDEIYISGVLEQIGSNEDLVHAMRECHRVLKPGRNMVIVVPNARYGIAHRDPMDIRKFTRETFLYFITGTQEWKLYGSVYGFPGWLNITIEENERHILTICLIK